MEEEFFVRYYSGHCGKFGHEFLEFEFRRNGKLLYINNSNYKHEKPIRRELYVTKIVLEELKRIIRESEVSRNQRVRGPGFFFFELTQHEPFVHISIEQITRESDSNWPKVSSEGKQELEIVLGRERAYFCCEKIGSLLDVQNSKDPEGLKCFYYLVQDLKCFVLSLTNLHYKVKPI